jgi:hypothetical protein
MAASVVIATRASGPKVTSLAARSARVTTVQPSSGGSVSMLPASAAGSVTSQDSVTIHLHSGTGTQGESICTGAQGPVASCGGSKGPPVRLAVAISRLLAELTAA